MALKHSRTTVEFPILAGHVCVWPLLHVGAGREHPARPGQDRDANIFAIGQRIEDADHLLAERMILGVHRRAVHDHRGDEILDCQLDGAVHARVL
jgi:hypothetical protein